MQVPGEFSYDKWIKGLDAGHSFVTTGPMLLVQFNEQSAGTVFKDQNAAVITGTAESRIPLDRIEIIVNGDVVRTIQPANRPTDSGGFSSPGHQSLDIVLVTVGGVFGLVSLIGFPAALFSNHDLMTVKRGNNAQFVGWSPLRLTGVGVAPAGATVKSGGTLGLTFAF